MKHHPLYDLLYKKLASSWQNLPDKPDETPESTLIALWGLAAGHIRANSETGAASLPPLDGDAADRLVSLIDRRLAGEPLAYLTGRQVFMGIEFLVSPGAMIPRKETEILARVAIDLAARMVAERGPIRVLDLCTGSGNLALVIASHVARSRVVGVDLAPEAVALAQANAVHLGLSERVHFFQGDLYSPFDHKESIGPFDLIVCNPPYISSARIDLLPGEIRDHEPRLALDGGPFGIRIIKRLIEETPRFLRPGSWICFEVGAGQGKSVTRMLKKLPAYSQVESFADSYGEVRVLGAQKSQKFARDALVLNPDHEIGQIVDLLQQTIRHRFGRKGAVVGISGGIDSSVVLSLCVQALGSQHVLGLLLPEKDSSPQSVILAHELADRFGVQTITEDITGALTALGCYRQRDEAVKRLVPEYEPGWAVRIALPGSLLEQETLNFFNLIVTDPQGNEIRKRLPPAEYAQIVAASNFKQRTRMSMLYYHAEMRSLCVVGTANKNEYELGFFVKHGDAGVDINPIIHLYKSQVYQLARHLDIPQSIQERIPTTDTYPGGGSQEEHFFRVPYEILDTVWLGYERNIPPSEIADILSLATHQVQRIIDDIIRKKRTTAFLRAEAVRLDTGLPGKQSNVDRF